MEHRVINLRAHLTLPKRLFGIILPARRRLGIVLAIPSQAAVVFIKSNILFEQTGQN